MKNATGIEHFVEIIGWSGIDQLDANGMMLMNRAQVERSRETISHLD